MRMFFSWVSAPVITDKEDEKPAGEAEKAK
jgi:hypothetical protein